MLKRFFTLLFAVLAGSALFAQSIPSYLPQQQSLWSYVPLNANLDDPSWGSPMTENGTSTFSYVPDRRGAASGAAYTDGFAYASRDISKDASRPDTAVTMMAWVKPTGNQNYSTVMGIRYNAQISPYNTLFLGQDAGKGKWIASVSTSNSSDATVDGPAFVLNQWVHVAMTYSTTAGKIRIFVDGQEQGSENVTGNIAYNTLEAFFTIGNSYGPGSHNFVGNIDDAVVYRRALTQAEIQQAMNPITNVNLNSGLMLHYTFNETLEDASPNNLDGTLNGTGAYVNGRDGSTNSALELNAVNSPAGYVTIPTVNFATSEYSMSAWIRNVQSSVVGGGSSWNNDCALFHLGTSANSNAGRISYGLSYGSGGEAYISHDGSTVSTTNTNHPTDGSWFHVVLVQKNGLAEIYLNGTKTLASAAIPGMSIGDKTDNWIGKTFFDAYANVAIDDFRLYNRELNSGEVNALYTGITGTEAPAPAVAATLVPNPARDHVRVQTESPVQEIRLLDLTGKTLLVTAEAELNVAELPAGLYLVQIRTAQGTAVQRLVKE